MPVGTSPDPFLPPSGPSSSGSAQASSRPNPSFHTAGYPHGPQPTDPTTTPGPSSRNDGYARNSSPGYPSNSSPSNTFRPIPPNEPGSPRESYESAPIESKLTRRHDFTAAGSNLPKGRLGANPDGTYVIQPNDSYWAISRNLYGTGAYFKALAEHNRAKYAQEDQLRVGDTIAAPDPAELEQKYPDLCPNPRRREAARQRASTVTNVSSRYAGERVYTVAEGDTLYDIARYQLGKGARWPEIYELNRESLQDNFDYLTPGLKLVMPDTRTDAVTRRPRRAQFEVIAGWAALSSFPAARRASTARRWMRPLPLGIPHGGWCPRGRLAEDGSIPERYALRETATSEYRERDGAQRRGLGRDARSAPRPDERRYALDPSTRVASSQALPDARPRPARGAGDRPRVAACKPRCHAERRRPAREPIARHRRRGRAVSLRGVCGVVNIARYFSFRFTKTTSPKSRCSPGRSDSMLMLRHWSLRPAAVTSTGMPGRTLLKRKRPSGTNSFPPCSPVKLS